MRREYIVYILRCEDGSYYTGVTNDLERRFGEHISGVNPECYTFERRPVQLVYSEAFRYVNDAIQRETVPKKWSKQKKEALIRENRNELRQLSKKKFPKSHKKQYASATRFNIFTMRFLVRSRLRRELLGMTEAS